MSTNVVELDNRSKAVLGVETEEIAKVELTNNIIYLRIDGDFNLNKDLATFFYSFDNKNWTPIGIEYKMIFDYRKLFMGTRYAIFNYATKQTGGYIDVNFFNYKRIW